MDMSDRAAYERSVYCSTREWYMKQSGCTQEVHKCDEDMPCTDRAEMHHLAWLHRNDRL